MKFVSKVIGTLLFLWVERSYCEDKRRGNMEESRF